MRSGYLNDLLHIPAQRNQRLDQTLGYRKLQLEHGFAKYWFCNTWLECYHSNQGSPGQMMHWMITQHPPNSHPPADWHVFRQYPDLFAIRVKIRGQ